MKQDLAPLSLHVFTAPVYSHGSTEICIMAVGYRAEGRSGSMPGAKLSINTPCHRLCGDPCGHPHLHRHEGH